MKINRHSRGSTLVEMMVTVAVVAMAGGSFFYILYSLAVLGAKNNAIDFSHQNARTLINHAVQQIHSSVSIPALVNSTLGAPTGSGAQAGVSYQVAAAGPGYVSATAASGQKQISIVMTTPPTTVDPTGDYSAMLVTPTAGMRLIVPAYELEDTITAVSVTASTTTSKTCKLTMTNNISTTITTTGASPNYQAYYTYRSALVVNGTNLLYYPDTSKATGTVATDISSGYAKTLVSNVTTATPFSVPGGNNNEISVSLATNEPNATARGYAEVNFQTTLVVPYRFRLAVFQ